MTHAPRHFAAVLADPAWAFKNYSEKGEEKNANQHYDCISVEAIKALPVAPVLAADAALFLWVTWPFLFSADEVAAAWGFPHYAGDAFVWVKLSSTAAKWHFGCGYWSRKNTEPCLMFTRGKPKRLNCDVPELLFSTLSEGEEELIVSPLRQHSEKPIEVYDRVERLVGGPYLELFSRKERPGWTMLGNAIDGLDLQQSLKQMASQPSLDL